jgi:cation diffusion facilitator family transporter
LGKRAPSAHLYGYALWSAIFFIQSTKILINYSGAFMATTSEQVAAVSSGRYREVLRVTLVGSLIDLVLGVAKLLGGYASHSQALVADGIHSLSDLATDFVVIYAAKHAHREPDRNHPYGHGRIETVATVGLAVAMLAVALSIAYDAAYRLINADQLLHPGPWALVIAVLSVLSKEAVYRYTLRAAKKLRSDMLRANAWHSRTDAISSLIVIFGVAGTMAGFDYLDAVAAVLVAVLIARIAVGLSWSSIRELIDTALESERVDTVRQVISETDGVKSMHMLRTRRMGSNALADVHIQVNPRLSVSEGHQISETVRARLIKKIDEITDVTVHIDPEDDEAAPSTINLPLRGQVADGLRPLWEKLPAAQRIEEVTLHYLHGKIHLQLALTMPADANLKELRDQEKSLKRACKQLSYVGEVVVYHRIAH